MWFLILVQFVNDHVIVLSFVANVFFFVIVVVVVVSLRDDERTRAYAVTIYNCGKVDFRASGVDAAFKLSLYIVNISEHGDAGVGFVYYMGFSEWARKGRKCNGMRPARALLRRSDLLEGFNEIL